MVLAYHSIITVRGFWLPNDPRGSWSDYVRCYELYTFGGTATKTAARHSLAKVPYDRKYVDELKTHLKYGEVKLDGRQARAVARGIARAVTESGYTIFASAILPDHMHHVIGRYVERDIEHKVGHMKARATQQLVEEGVHPFLRHRGNDGQIPCVWAQRGWNVFLDSSDDIHRAIRYVNNNPLKHGLKAQAWSYVTPFLG